MGVSIQDIANALNLSKATVSFILSGRGESRGFSTETIRRVKAYAEQVNYRPNYLARGLSSGRSTIIGLIIPTIGDTFYAQMIQAVEVCAQQKGYTLMVCSSEGNAEKEDKLIRDLRSQQVDGLILAPVKSTHYEIDKLIDDNYPFVLIDRYFPEMDTNYVIINNCMGSISLVDQLVARGAKKIVVATSDIHLKVMTERMDGFRDGLRKNGMEFEEYQCLTIEKACYRQDVVKQLDALFAAHHDVDSFLFTTHYLALEFIRYFIDNKIDYNQQLHLACFHDTISLDILAPKIIIARMPIEAMGEKAVDLLDENIRFRIKSPDKKFNHQGVIMKTQLQE